MNILTLICANQLCNQQLVVDRRSRVVLVGAAVCDVSQWGDVPHNDNGVYCPRCMQTLNRNQTTTVRDNPGASHEQCYAH